jgi:hypothetical protein
MLYISLFVIFVGLASIIYNYILLKHANKEFTLTRKNIEDSYQKTQELFREIYRK